MKKAQGLPLNTIVIFIIAILVLVLVIVIFKDQFKILIRPLSNMIKFASEFANATP